MEQQEYQMNLGEIFIVVRRKWHWVALGAIVLAALTTLVAVFMPTVYMSKGTILIESQQISQDLVGGGAQQFANERIEVVKQRVLTRENLLKIAEKHQLFPKQRQSLTSSEILDLIRKNIFINLLSADTGRRSTVTIAFEVQYEADRADHAHRVANDLVTLFLDENLRARTESATEATAFLSEQAEILKKDLEQIENKVGEYKQLHANALPENQELYMTTLQRLEASQKEIDADYKSTQSELKFLEVELAGANAGVGVRQDGNAFVSPETELDRLKAEYTKLQAVYKENHPTLKSLKHRIEGLEKQEKNSAPDAKDNTGLVAKQAMSESELLIEKIQVRIDAARDRLESLAKQKAAAQAKIAQLESQVGQTPQVQRELTVLMRDYENAKKKYEEVKSKQLSAKITENLEQDNKAERFTLIDPPVLPDKPIRPDRVKILAGGIAASLFLPIFAVIGLEVLAKRVRGVEGIQAVLGRAPIVAIPYIENYEDRLTFKRRIKIAIIVMTVLLFALLAGIHFLYMPLDIVMAKLSVIF